jgi:hypothetical protein
MILATVVHRLALKQQAIGCALVSWRCKLGSAKYKLLCNIT